MAKVLIKKLDSSVELPAYKTSGASGMDLMAFLNEAITLKPKNSCLVPTGISVAFPSEFEIQIRPRSGLAAKNNISVLNTPGTVDSDYRGEIKVILYNHGVCVPSYPELTEEEIIYICQTIREYINEKWIYITTHINFLQNSLRQNKLEIINT